MEIVRRGTTRQNLSRVLILSAKASRTRFCGAALMHATSKLQDTAISMDQVREIAVTEPIPLSLRQMHIFADGGAKVRVASAKFLHKELQSRFARAIVELSDLPLGLSNTAAIQQAIDVYRRELQWISTTSLRVLS
ncbi:hypothetical protein DVH05_006491 [Phytophthora capsici]|nr:hypothetical protein DVH05_006491 [Phytophthora capsici]